MLSCIRNSHRRHNTTMCLASLHLTSAIGPHVKHTPCHMCRRPYQFLLLCPALASKKPASPAVNSDEMTTTNTHVKGINCNSMLPKIVRKNTLPVNMAVVSLNLSTRLWHIRRSRSAWIRSLVLGRKSQAICVKVCKGQLELC